MPVAIPLVAGLPLCFPLFCFFLRLLLFLLYTPTLSGLYSSLRRCDLDPCWKRVRLGRGVSVGAPACVLSALSRRLGFSFARRMDLYDMLLILAFFYSAVVLRYTRWALCAFPFAEVIACPCMFLFSLYLIDIALGFQALLYSIVVSELCDPWMLHRLTD